MIFFTFFGMKLQKYHEPCVHDPTSIILEKKKKKKNS